ncbi:unnamed protein product [Colias eurytheme]|nr:unnamed protein product [Colias eurytheme]
MNNSIRITRNLQSYVFKPFVHRFSKFTYNRLLNTSVKEIKIPVPWGHVAGKVWGDAERRRPILALHGWQDNAGTWDTLAPLLCDKIPILAIDFPGHGLSSWHAPGLQYYPWETVRLILAIKTYYQWDKVTVLSHSMGSIAAIRYSCIFPDDLDYLIAIDCLFPEEYQIKQFVENYPKIISKLQSILEKPYSDPPLYSYNDIIHKWHVGSNKSISVESIKVLAKRGIQKSLNDPEKYHFSKDGRISYAYYDFEDKFFLEALTMRSKCPILFLKAIHSPFSMSNTFARLQKTIEESNPNFEKYLIPGTHHVHLDNPDVVIPHIEFFLRKYKLI